MANARKKKSIPSPIEASTEPTSGISAVKVEGFKSIRKQTEIALKPLTILAGANSSGKSSIMQPLLLMKQTLEAPSEPDIFLLDGPNVRFTSAQQVFSRFGNQSADVLMVGFRTISDRSVLVSYKREPKGGFDIIAMSKASQLGLWETRRVADLVELAHGHAVAVRERCFLALRRLRRPEDASSGSLGERLMDPLAITQVRNGLLSMIHVPAMHGNPERTYRANAAGPTFPGTFEPYVASIIHHWQVSKDPRLRQLGAALEKLGLTWKVEAVRVDDTRFELRAGRLKRKAAGGARDLVSIADV